MKLVLAGGEAWWKYFEKHGIMNVLCSFHYLRSVRDFAGIMGWIKSMKDRHGDKCFLMLDSGAFTFQQDEARACSEELDEYADEYANFIKEYGHYFDVIAELDVYYPRVIDGERVIEPMERVRRWREKLWKVAGNRLMPVMKGNILSIEECVDICKDVRWKWVAVSSHVNDDPTKDLEIQKTLINIGHTYHKKVHGFAMTRLQTDFKLLYSYDSVDSTTWLRADQFGGTFIYLVKTGFLIILSHLQKEMRRLYRAYFKEIGLDMRRIMGEHRPHAASCDRRSGNLAKIDPDDTGKCQACKDQLEELRASSLIAWRNLIERYSHVKIRKFSNFKGGYRNDSGASNNEAQETKARQVNDNPKRERDPPQQPDSQDGRPARDPGRDEREPGDGHQAGDHRRRGPAGAGAPEDAGRGPQPAPGSSGRGRADGAPGRAGHGGRDAAGAHGALGGLPGLAAVRERAAGAGQQRPADRGRSRRGGGQRIGGGAASPGGCPAQDPGGSCQALTAAAGTAAEVDRDHREAARQAATLIQAPSAPTDPKRIKKRRETS